jgi:hypothetical protein
MKARIPGNVTLLYQKKDKNGMYCRSISEYSGAYGLVLVDGKDRVNSVKQAVEFLSARGVILLDDSVRPQYAECMEVMRKKGFRALTLEGLKPTGDENASTTVFYREGNCLEI